MVNPWVYRCGARQAERRACSACGHPDTLDARDSPTIVRELMRDVDMRLGDRREGRLRFLGVGVVVFALWMVPGYWSLRGTLYPGLPLLIDQGRGEAVHEAAVPVPAGRPHGRLTTYIMKSSTASQRNR